MIVDLTKFPLNGSSLDTTTGVPGIPATENVEIRLVNKVVHTTRINATPTTIRIGTTT